MPCSAGSSLSKINDRATLLVWVIVRREGWRVSRGGDGIGWLGFMPKVNECLPMAVRTITTVFSSDLGVSSFWRNSRKTWRGQVVSERQAALCLCSLLPFQERETDLTVNTSHLSGRPQVSTRACSCSTSDTCCEVLLLIIIWPVVILRMFHTEWPFRKRAHMSVGRTI